MTDHEIVRAGTGQLMEQVQIAKALAPSDIIPQAYRDKPANIVVAIEFGQSMGLSPAESLYRINIIKGKPTMSAELVAAQVRKAGHKLRIAKDKAKVSVTCTIVRADDPKYPFVVTRDAAWAKQMGLTGKDNYVKQPLTMLTWRAITACAREACPEALFGAAYTPDEMHDMDAAPAVEVAPEVAAPAAESAQDEPARRRAGGADVAPIRELFNDYRAARGGIAAGQASAELARVMGVTDMSAELTRDQVDGCVRAMRETIDTWRSRTQAAVTDGHDAGQAAHAGDAEAEAQAMDAGLYDEEVEF